jgi:glycosyltransferase involved in cell wall biosynthesis
MPDPLVSCIMPTRDRRPFVAQAIEYFARQTYPARELVIVDDGEDRVEDLADGHENVRYIRLQTRTPLGEKRNIACAHSQGELIAHWDDDDWSAPDRLLSQIASLRASNARVCGAASLYHFAPTAASAGIYHFPHFPERQCAWLAGGTLLYRKSAWARHPFPAVDVAEDVAFVRRFPPGHVLTVETPPYYVALVHGGNTRYRTAADPRWESLPLEEVSALIADDWTFYAGLRSGLAVTQQPVLSREAPNSITMSGHFMVYDGYGSMAEYLALGLQREGALVNVQPNRVEEAGLCAELLDLIRTSNPDPAAPVLHFNPVDSGIERYSGVKDLFINTMWESDRLPASWLPHMNRARAIIVPTRWVARVCRESGVTAPPVYVIPEGIDPTVYRYDRPPDRPSLTTLMVGTNIDRKHVREGVAAWKLAFENDPDARLILKSRFQYRSFVPDDPRINFVDTNEPSRGIAHWYAEADVLMALGNEGFGLPLVEAMATGMTVIALSSEGQGDVCEDAQGLVLPVPAVRWEPHEQFPYGRCGMRGVPAVEDIADRLQWIRTHRKEAAQMGCAASRWARKYRNIWDKAPAVLDVMEKHLSPPRSLRPRAAANTVMRLPVAA